MKEVLSVGSDDFIITTEFKAVNQAEKLQPGDKIPHHRRVTQIKCVIPVHDENGYPAKWQVVFINESAIRQLLATINDIEIADPVLFDDSQDDDLPF